MRTKAKSLFAGMLALLMAVSLIIPMYNVQAANISSGFIGTDGFGTVEVGKTYTINGKRFACIRQNSGNNYQFIAIESFGSVNWINVYNVEPNWYYSDGGGLIGTNSDTGKISSGTQIRATSAKDLSFDGNRLINDSNEAANSTVKDWYNADVKAISTGKPYMPGCRNINSVAQTALASTNMNVLLGDIGTGYDITGSNSEKVTIWVEGNQYNTSSKSTIYPEYSNRRTYNQDNIQDPEIIDAYTVGIKSYSGALLPLIDIDMAKCQIKNGVISKATATSISATQNITKVMSTDKVDLSQIVKDVKYNTGESAAYTVSFDSKYGTISGNTWTVASGLDGNTTVPITITSKSFGLTTTVNVELISIFNLTYDLAGGSVNGNPATYKTSDNDITLKNPTRKGYEFKGWTGTDIASPTTTVTIKSGSSGNRAYTANWDAKTYNVSLNKNGGSGGTDKISVTYDSTTIPNIDAPTRTSNTATYEFLGYFNSNGEKIYNADGSPAVSKWTTDENSLTATWKETPKVNPTPDNDNNNNNDNNNDNDNNNNDEYDDINNNTDNNTNDNSNISDIPYNASSNNVLLVNYQDNTAVVKDDVLEKNVVVPLSYTTEGEVYRMYDASRGEHFYTKDADEAKGLTKLGWSHEKEADFVVVSAIDSDSIAVYRLYNPNDGGMHFYTSDASEVKALIDAGWSYEGISHYVYATDASKGTLQYRLYNPNSTNGEHNWTADVDEYEMLKKAGWVDEGGTWRIA